MKNIVKQFKESISKLTPEELKKIWDEIETEIGTNYPVFNAKTNCFEYKINNTETLEKAIEENYWNTITACEDSNNTNIKYVKELINTSFINGIKFAQRWISVDDELPPCSDEDILIKGVDNRGIEGMCDIGYMHSSPNNIPNKENFIFLSGEIIKVTHWRYLELK